MYVVVYADATDPIVATLLKTPSLRAKCVFVSLVDLLTKTHIDDRICNGIPELSWTLQDGRKVTNSNDATLINRVTSLPTEAICGFSFRRQGLCSKGISRLSELCP